MGINRYDTSLDHSFFFDPAIPGALMPQFGDKTLFNEGTSATTTGGSLNMSVGRACTIGSGADLYFSHVQMSGGASLSVNQYLYFGMPVDNYNATTASTTYGAGQRTQTVIYKKPTQSLTATWIMRTPKNFSNSTSDIPQILYGINYQVPAFTTTNTMTRSISSRALFYSTAPTGTTLAMTDTNSSNATDVNTTSATATWVADTEYACSITIDASGNCTTNIAGCQSTSTFIYSTGVFSLALGHVSSNTSNYDYPGWRNVRITVY